MPSPILPSEFKALVPAGSGSLCDKLLRALKNFPLKFSQWYSYVYGENGDFTDEFKADLCAIDCDALPPSGSSGDTGDSTTVTTAPAPTFGTISVGQVRLNWNAIPSAAYYEIVRNTENDLLTATWIADTTLNFYDDTTTVDDTWYFYWVRGREGTGVGPFSAPVIAWSSSGAVPAITVPVVSATDGTFPEYASVTWPICIGATMYEVRRNTVNDWGTGDVLALTPMTFWNDFTGLPGDFYYYFVRAYNIHQTSAESTSDLGNRA